MKTSIITTALAAAIAMGATSAAFAGPLENLERERALAVQTMLDPALSAEERQGKLELAKYRLVDLERMVIRDDSLVGNNTPTVRAAFRNYDLTFLVHSSIEKELTLTDQWFEQVGLTTNAILDARVGRRW